ncbi:transposase [Candidatus Daviesbacteria bacterium]|nr:transposase [Candidatus Daviesbacteria bacterium]
MATNRKIVFANEGIYHVFNRGLDRRPTFTNKWEFDRAKKLVKFYRHKDIPIRFSKLIQQPEDIRNKILEDLYKSDRLVDILSFCLMPNHFHFLLKQNVDKGIATFVANFTNAYTKYFNTRNTRIGPLFQGIFKAVLVENDEQLVHVSRYIHLNPVVSSIIETDELKNYPWSSYPEYLSQSDDEIAGKALVLNMFKSPKEYQKFVLDQIDYGKKLEAIKHLIME